MFLKTTDTTGGFMKGKNLQDILLTAINQSSEGVAVIDLDGNLLYVNDSFAKMHGFTPEEDLAGKHFTLFHTPEQMPAVQEANRLLKETGVFKGEVWHARQDGSVFPSIMHNTLVRDDQGTPVCLLGMMRDISQQKEVEFALKASEEKHRHLVSHMSDGIIMQNEHGVITYVNSRFCEMVGYPLTEVVGKKSIELLDKKSRQIMLKEITRCDQGLGPRPYEMNMIRKDGSMMPVLISPQGLFDPDGKSKGSFGVCTDVSMYKQMEDALNNERERLEELVKQRTAELRQMNTTLKVLLEQRKQERKQVEDSIMANVQELLMPSLIRLKNGNLSIRQQTEVNVLEANLNEIISPFADNISSSYLKLTPTEVQVANLIKHGTSSKDIAASLGLSQRTVDTHRYNIRKKIGIRGKGINLRTYLSSLK